MFNACSARAHVASSDLTLESAIWLLTTQYLHPSTPEPTNLNMTSRNRLSTRPTPSRSSVVPTPARRTAAPPDELPPHIKPSHPLNQRAQDQLRTLNGRSITYLKEQNTKAAEVITNAAGGVNDKLREREEWTEKRRKWWEKGLDVENREGDEERLARFKDQVDEMTKQLEESMRAVIDGTEAAQRIEQSLVWLRDNAPGQLEREYQTQMTQQETQRETQRLSQSQRRRRTQDSDGDVDMEEEDDEPEGPTPGPTPLDGSRPILTGVSELFVDRQTRKKDEYTSISLGGRYSKNNAYIGFKRMVHDAKFQEMRALPHADTWFQEGGSPAPGVTHPGNSDDDDIVMDREKISTRCPLTFQTFKEPWTSTKCPHTFEKSAILGMIMASNVRLGGGGGRAVQCPMSGCDQVRIVFG
jgi:hypothetical protein